MHTMNKNRKYWLNLTLVLALLAAPLQAVMAAQTMMGHPDCMEISGMVHHAPDDSTGGSQMTCHGDEANTVDTCTPDCSECSSCTGNAAASFSTTSSRINPVHIFSVSPPEETGLFYLSSEFRPPRV